MDGIHKKHHNFYYKSLFQCVYSPRPFFTTGTPKSASAHQHSSEEASKFCSAIPPVGSEMWAPKNPLGGPEISHLWRVYRYIPSKGPRQQPVNHFIIVNVGWWFTPFLIFWQQNPPPKESDHETPIKSLANFHNFWFLSPKNLRSDEPRD